MCGGTILSPSLGGLVYSEFQASLSVRDSGFLVQMSYLKVSVKPQKSLSMSLFFDNSSHKLDIRFNLQWRQSYANFALQILSLAHWRLIRH